MRFDPWAIEPPLGEFSSLIGWLSLAACIIGWVSCALIVARRKACSADWLVCRWALLCGAAAGAGVLYGLAHEAELDPFLSLFLNWVLGSVFGAGFLVWASRSADRRILGRRIIQAVALFMLGIPVPLLLGVLTLQLLAR